MALRGGERRDRAELQKPDPRRRPTLAGGRAGASPFVAARTWRAPAPYDGDGMNTAAIVTFVIIAGLVWGGFALIIATAFRRERRKQLDEG
jgi:hypothetical protein